MTEVNQGKFEVICNDDVIRLDVTVSKAVLGMKIEYCCTHLSRKVSLKLSAEFIPHTISIVVV